LHHEHARPDAGLFVDLRCEKLPEYEEARMKAQVDAKRHFKSTTDLETRMRKV